MVVTVVAGVTAVAGTSGGGGSSGTITQISSGTGLTGGPVTSSGTLSFASIAASSLWANVSTGTAVPVVTTLGAGLAFSGTTIVNTSGSSSGVSTGGIADLRNFLYNSAMQIDQRREGASTTISTGTAGSVLDNWYVPFTQAAAVVTAQRVVDAPTGAFTPNSFKITVSTGSTVGSTDQLVVQSKIEGYNSAKLLYGTVSAQVVSIGFQVKSSISGIYGFALRNNANDRVYITSYTVSSPNAWEYKTISNIPGDITGTWLTSNGIGLKVIWVISQGSSFQTTSVNSWVGSAAVLSPTTLTNTVLSTTGATWQLTQPQLELATTAGTYQYLPFEVEYARALRYYRKSFNMGTVPAQSGGLPGAITVKNPIALGDPSEYIQFDPPMRANPTIVTYNPSVANANWRNITAAADVVVQVDPATTLGMAGVLVATSGTVTTLGDILAIHYTADAAL